MSVTNKILALAALGEAVTGVVLLAYPPIVVRLLFGVEIVGAGFIMSRLAGIALIGLGVACWPGNSAAQQLYGMLTYSTLAMMYLIRIGIRGAPSACCCGPARRSISSLSFFLEACGGDNERLSRHKKLN